MNQKLLRQIIGVGLIVLFLVGCGTPTPTPTPIPPTPTPGIGVPVTSGGWQVTITNAHKTTEWFGRTTKSGFVFLLVDVTFHSLDAAQKTLVSAGDTSVISEDGKTSSPSGAITDSDKGNVGSINGVDASGAGDFTCICQPVFEANGDIMSFTLVFALSADAASKTLKFQFQAVQIPFSVK